MASSQRQYDIVLYGATGYTGKYTAEYIVKSQPSNLSWAISGRSVSKLESLIKDELTPLNRDRIPPAVEAASLDLAELKALAKKTRVLINAVGPYSLYGHKVVQACAEEGTSYVDTTGETPWTKEMIDKWEETAKKTGATLIPQCGLESAVSDVLAYAIALHIRRQYSLPTRRVTTLIWAMRARASGGTLNSVLSLCAVYPLKAIFAALAPYALSPLPPPPTHFSSRPSLLARLSRALFGVRRLPHGQGLATTSITSSTNASSVTRSWGQNPTLYGPRFEYEELLAVRSRARGLAMHWGLALGSVVMAAPPARWVARKFVYQPGQGPTKEETKRDFVEYRAVGEIDRGQEGSGEKAADVVRGRLYWKGGMYEVSGMLMVEAARAMLEGEGSTGFITAAGLGERYLDGIRKGGLVLEVEG